MATKFSVELIANNLPKFEGEVRTRLARALDKIAANVEGGAKQRAPVDTGFLKNSIGPVKRTGDLSREIPVGAEYGAFVELGTVKMAAQPYLVPAVEAQRNTFNAMLAAAVQEAADASGI